MMDFEAACEALGKGKHVSRAFWLMSGTSIYIDGSRLLEWNMPNAGDYQFTLDDVRATDWVISTGSET